MAKSLEPSRSGFNMNLKLVSFELGFPGCEFLTLLLKEKSRRFPWCPWPGPLS